MTDPHKAIVEGMWRDLRDKATQREAVSRSHAIADAALCVSVLLFVWTLIVVGGMVVLTLFIH